MIRRVAAASIFLGIEGGSDAFAYHIKEADGAEDGDESGEHEPGSDVVVFMGLSQQFSPGSGGRSESETEVVEAGESDDSACDTEGGECDDGVECVGEYLFKDDVAVFHAEGAAGFHEIEFSQAQKFGSHVERYIDPSED